MEQKSPEEIDLIFLYKIFKNFVKRWVIRLFRGLNFIIKKRKLLLTLLIIGIGLGVVSNIFTKLAKKAELLIKVNFDAVNYVYSSISLLNEKITDKDSIFLSNIGLSIDSLEINEVDIIPQINIKDIIEKYPENDKSLEAILKNLEINELFDEKDTKMDRSFISEYKYHNILLSLSSYSNQGTVDLFLDYLNDNEFLEQLKNTTVKNLEEHLTNNAKIVEQIDRLLDTYYTNESIASPKSEIYVVDKNFSVASLLTTKVELQKESEIIKEELVYSKDIVIVVNNPKLADEEKSITSNKAIFYPFVLIFLYLLFSLFKHIYSSLKEMVDNE